MSAVPAAAREAALAFRRSARHGLRRPIVAVGFPALIPALLVVLVSQLYRDLARAPGFPTASYVAWFGPAVFLMPAMFGAGFSASTLVGDYQTGFLDRLRLLSAHPVAQILGRLAFDVVRVAAAGLVVLAVAVTLGVRVTGGVAGLGGMVLLLTLWTVGYCGLYYVVALASRSPETLLALIPLFLPVSLLSTAFVPATLMPDWIRVVARANPFSYLCDGVRLFTTGPFSWGPFAVAVAAATALAAITLGLSAHMFRQVLTED